MHLRWSRHQVLGIDFRKRNRDRAATEKRGEQVVSGADGELASYQEKRDFGITPESSPNDGDLSWAAERPVFRIQEHAASSLHYDFRIEVEGVLKSWAVPKGLSTDPSVRRLAIPNEDHPLSHADFEGVIPEGEYGGGTVLVWDRGSYRNLKEAGDDREGPRPVSEQLDEGDATIWLEGEQLSGGHALIRTSEGDDPMWLLIKMRDVDADARRKPTSTEPASVKGGRTLEEIDRDEAGGA